MVEKHHYHLSQKKGILQIGERQEGGGFRLAGFVDSDLQDPTCGFRIHLANYLKNTIRYRKKRQKGGWFN